MCEQVEFQLLRILATADFWVVRCAYRQFTTYCYVIWILFKLALLWFSSENGHGKHEPWWPAECVSVIPETHRWRFWGGAVLERFLWLLVDLIFLVISLCTLGDALVTFKLNTTSSGKLYFFLDEKWPLVEQTSQCQNRLDMAQYSCKSNNLICLILMNGKDSLCMHIENVPSTLSDILGSAHNVWQTSLTSRNDQHITSPFKISWIY